VTQRIYYDDPYAQEFEAVVLEVGAAPPDAPPGARQAILDRTAFYPTSGGQPFDVGTLGAAAVVDVIDLEDGRIAHVVQGPVEIGPLQGRIDWPRRFDHMQQHTGQHVLSAAFDRAIEAATVSFHLGSTSSTIDLGREVSAAEIARAEAVANKIVWEDRPVTIRYADADEAVKLPLRKPPARGGPLRLIDVEGFDLSACGGTHVSRTGAIGMIAVAAAERFRGGTRVEFLCGGRALDGYRILRESVSASVRLLSVLPAELPAAVERLQLEARDLKRQVKDLHARLGSFEAEAMAARAESIGSVKAVIAALDGLDAGGLKTVASAIAGRPGHLAVVVSTPAPSAIVIARAGDVTLDAAALLKQLLARFGGKGGGRPEMAQGGGLQADAADVLAAARALIGGA
jgi:alanyl-tRNA synthetase